MELCLYNPPVRLHRMNKKHFKTTDKFLCIIQLNFSLHQFDQGLSWISSTLGSVSKSHVATHVSHAALPNTKFKIQPNCPTKSSAAFSNIPLSIAFTSPLHNVSRLQSTILVALQSYISPSPIVTKRAATHFLLLCCSSTHVSVFEV